MTNYKIKNVQAVDNYHLILTFQNGEIKTFDMKPYLNKGIFKELQDVQMFKTVRVNFDTIQWNNDADFDPEALYEMSLPIKNNI